MNKKTILKGLCVCGIAILGVVLLGAYLLWGWILKPELAARCDNNITIWRRNPGAFLAIDMKYVAEIKPVEYI